jgi:hypothetical protein
MGERRSFISKADQVLTVTCVNVQRDTVETSANLVSYKKVLGAYDKNEVIHQNQKCFRM